MEKKEYVKPLLEIVDLEFKDFIANPEIGEGLSGVEGGVDDDW